jgi:tRNA (mo5U34)-methyltransferase
VVGDFMTMDLAALGTFDVVLFLGVLYHLKHPLLGLERLRSVTGELAVIETEAVGGPGSYLEFYGGRELGDDPTNWWAPTEDALVALCRTAGFARVDVKVGCPPRAPSLRRRLRHILTAKQGQPPHYRAIVHAAP